MDQQTAQVVRPVILPPGRKKSTPEVEAPAHHAPILPPARHAAHEASPVAAPVDVAPAARDAAHPAPLAPETNGHHPAPPSIPPTPTAAMRTAAPVKATTPAKSGQQQDDEADPAADDGVLGILEYFYRQPSWVTSMVFHMIVLLVMGLWTVSEMKKHDLVLTMADVKPLPELEEVKLDHVMLEEKFDDGGELELDTKPEAEVEPVTIIDNIDVGAAAAAPDIVKTNPEIASIIIDAKPEFFGGTGRGRGDAQFGTGKGGHGMGAGLGGRSARRKAGGGKGATPHSEAAVEAALKWLAEHQLPDGSWSFDHTGGKCNKQCGNPGGLAQATVGATAMGVLPFLGAGHTHLEGKYKTNVAAALKWLIAKQGADGSLWEQGGQMYSHALATIALCEAYGMGQMPIDGNAIESPGEALGKKPPEGATDSPSGGLGKKNDKKMAKGMNGPLGAAAQKAIDYLVNAQHDAGGWRYTPKMAGDISVVGWAVMALKSGHMANLNVPRKTVAGSIVWLDSISGGYGDEFGYTQKGEATPVRNAIGLLCRMHTGWKREHPGMISGVTGLAKVGFSRDDMYHNYYAMQVMHHFQGPLWEAWNTSIREFLISTQEKNGHQTGSWMFGGGHGSAVGGRLYNTSLACMCLEVYYRVMPLYDSVGFEEKAPKRQRKPLPPGLQFGDDKKKARDFFPDAGEEKDPPADGEMPDEKPADKEPADKKPVTEPPAAANPDDPADPKAPAAPDAKPLVIPAVPALDAKD